MKILYLGYFCTEELFLNLSKKDKDFSVAAHKYEKQLLTNLSKLLNPSDIKCISVLSYLKEDSARETRDSFCGIEIQYVWKERKKTLPSLTAFKNIKQLVSCWLKETDGEERIVVTYATNLLLMYPFLFTKRGVKIVTICSELPQYRIQTGNKIKRWAKKVVNVKLNKLMDGYVFFSKHMNEKTNPKNKPFIVVEGLPDIRITEKEINSDTSRKEQIFYAGYLIKENGIETLLQAFSRLRHKDVQLVLCGSGDMVKQIEEHTKVNERVKYLGSLPNEEILQLEREATLLINPRKADHLLTRYSFPSKTFEYFSSGTPTVLTKLDGIPEEYYQYCYICDSSDTERLAQDLDTILSIPLKDRLLKARKAYSFVVEEKSASMQVKRILNFLVQLNRR